MADVITGNTQLTVTKEALIASVVQKEIAFQAKLLPYVTDVSAYANPGFKSISFPAFGSFTVEKRASGASGNAQTSVATIDTLALDQNAYVSWLIDSKDELQSKVAVQAEFAKRAASAHARAVDTDIISAIAGAVGFNQGAATTITQSILLDCREFVMKNQADPSKVYVLMGRDQEKAMLQIADFVRADAYGTSNIGTGVIGKVYGMPVVVHDGLAASTVYVLSSDAIAFGFQAAPAYA